MSCVMANADSKFEQIQSHHGYKFLHIFMSGYLD